MEVLSQFLLYHFYSIKYRTRCTLTDSMHMKIKISLVEMLQ